jgi:serine/threonine protein kinase
MTDSINHIDQNRLNAFKELFAEKKQSHFWLACHAAIPVALTSDLLYKIWLNFSTDEANTPLHIPLTAVAELLNSPICRKMGHDLFEIYPSVSSELRRQLQDDARFGQARLNKIAAFLRAYKNYNPHKIPSLIFAESIEWVADSYLHPKRAAERILEQFTKVQEGNGQESGVEISLSWVENRNALVRRKAAAGSMTTDSLLITEALIRGVQQYQKGKEKEGLAMLKQIKPFLEGEERNGLRTVLPEGVLREMGMEDIAPNENKLSFEEELSWLKVLIGDSSEKGYLSQYPNGYFVERIQRFSEIRLMIIKGELLEAILKLRENNPSDKFLKEIEIGVNRLAKERFNGFFKDYEKMSILTNKLSSATLKFIESHTYRNYEFSKNVLNKFFSENLVYSEKLLACLLKGDLQFVHKYIHYFRKYKSFSRSEKLEVERDKFNQNAKDFFVHEAIDSSLYKASFINYFNGLYEELNELFFNNSLFFINDSLFYGKNYGNTIPEFIRKLTASNEVYEAFKFIEKSYNFEKRNFEDFNLQGQYNFINQIHLQGIVDWSEFYGLLSDIKGQLLSLFEPKQKKSRISNLSELIELFYKEIQQKNTEEVLEIGFEISNYVKDEALSNKILLGVSQFLHLENDCEEGLLLEDLYFLKYKEITGQVRNSIMELEVYSLKDEPTFLPKITIFDDKDFINDVLKSVHEFSINERIMDIILILSTKQQQTWLIATTENIYCVLNDKITFNKRTFLQWRMSLDEADGYIRVGRKNDDKDFGLLDIGKRRNWLYNTKLFPNIYDLHDAIEVLLKKGQTGNGKIQLYRESETESLNFLQLDNNDLLKINTQTYTIHQKIDQGGFGNIYCILNNKEEKFALKLYNLETFQKKDRAKLKERFEFEYRAAETQSPYVIKVLHKGFLEGNPFLLMDYYPTDLEVSLDEFKEEKEIKDLAIKILEGLKALHDNNIIHGDLKPANILLDEKNNPLIIDFFKWEKIDKNQEIRFWEMKNARETNETGIMAYMSPEQISGEVMSSYQSDIYSFGILMYQVLFKGELPFKKRDGFLSKFKNRVIPLIEQSHNITDEWKHILIKCLQFHENRRFKNVQEIIDFLENDKTLLKEAISPFYYEMVLIKAGVLGDSKDIKKENIEARTFKDFYAGKYLVTFDLYDYFCESEKIPKVKDEGWGRENRPLINVDYIEALKFCNWLSLKNSLEPVYMILEKGEFEINKEANGFRIPTVLQWSYMAIGGSGGKKMTYAGSDSLDEVGWYRKNSKPNFWQGRRTHPVGQKKPNSLGLFDMSGNVFEWVLFIISGQTNYDYPFGDNFVGLRGGSYNQEPVHCQIDSSQNYFWGMTHLNEIGFRLVRNA